jgi:hypothetical protein
MKIISLENLIQISHIFMHVIGFSDSFGNRIRSLKWSSLELTHTNILLVGCGFTNHMLTPIHSTAQILLPLLQLHRDIWPQSRVFSHLQSWYVLPLIPPQRIHDEHRINRDNLSIYLEFLTRTYYSYARTLWELF